ncbi:MAG: WD40 repeat domain-containing protein [Candidatus Poribacteria bacterium]|nr:WD40 repeat domain-containing protein [Candidatus Poribacteria bacterium]
MMPDKTSVIYSQVDVNESDVTTWELPEGAIARLGRGREPDFDFSPDGQYLAIGTSLGLWLYDLAELSPIALWEIQRGMVGCVAFSPNGKWIATSNSDNILKVLDIQNGVCLTKVESDEYITGLTFSPDNQYIAAAYSRSSKVEIWYAETGEPVVQFTADTEEASFFRPISFSPDTRLIVSTCRFNTTDEGYSVIVWNMESREQIACFSAHTKWISTICFSPCGKFLVSGGEDGTVNLWDVNTWQKVQTYSDYGDVYRIIPSYTPDGILRAAIINYDESAPVTISVCDLESGEEIYNDQVWGNTVQFCDADDWGNFLVFSNGSQLAYECRHDFINVWTPEYPYKRQFTHSPISFPASTHSPKAFPTFAVFTDDGKTLAVKHHHEGVVLWDIASRRSRPAITVESAGKNQFLYKTESGKLYVASIKDDNVMLWEVDGNGIPLIEGTERKYWSAFPALSPTGKLFAYADEEGNIKVWDVDSGNQLYELKHPLGQSDDDDDEEDDTICDLQFSFDGKILASESDYPCAHVISWDMERGEEIDNSLSDNAATRIRGRLVFRHLKPRSREVVHISHDRKYLSSIGNNPYLYDVKQNDYLTRFSLPKGLEDMFWVAEFSMCGKYFAAGTWWHEGMEKMVICLYEVETGKQIATFKGHSTDVHALAFSPDNKILASTSYDGTILLWDLTPYI